MTLRERGVRRGLLKIETELVFSSITKRDAKNGNKSRNKNVNKLPPNFTDSKKWLYKSEEEI